MAGSILLTVFRRELHDVVVASHCLPAGANSGLNNLPSWKKTRLLKSNFICCTGCLFPRRGYSRFLEGLISNQVKTKPPWRVLFFGTDEYALVHLKALNENRSVAPLLFIQYFLSTTLQWQCSASGVKRVFYMVIVLNFPNGAWVRILCQSLLPYYTRGGLRIQNPQHKTDYAVGCRWYKSCICVVFLTS